MIPRQGLDFLTSPRFQFLSPAQREEIHYATVEVLKRTGVRVGNRQAVELLKSAGADVSDGNLVRIPLHLIQWALDKAPAQFTFYNREGSPALQVGGRRTYFGTGSGTLYAYDQNGVRRRTRQQDIVNAVRVADYLPNIDFVMSMGTISDCDERISDILEFEAMVKNTSKPFMMTTCNFETCKKVIDMAAAVAGGFDELKRKPFLGFYNQPIAPLRHIEDSLEKTFYCCDTGLPVFYGGGGHFGGLGAPATLAGQVIIGNALCMSGLVMIQLYKEGHPCLYGGGGGFADFSATGKTNMGSPDSTRSRSILAEMANDYYHLPSWGFAGGNDVKVIDQQAAMENTFTIFAALLAGVNIAHDIGYVEGALGYSIEALVMNDEIISMLRYFMTGVDLNAETIPLDVIDRVGPEGNYMAEEHTLRHFRDDWVPKLLDKDTFERWKDNGSLTMGDRIRQKAQDIVSNHQPRPLTESICREVDRIIDGARKSIS